MVSLVVAQEVCKQIQDQYPGFYHIVISPDLGSGEHHIFALYVKEGKFHGRKYLLSDNRNHWENIQFTPEWAEYKFKMPDEDFTEADIELALEFIQTD